jgi:hypothetical protein
MASIIAPNSEFKKLLLVDQINCFDILDRYGLAVLIMATAHTVATYNKESVVINLGRLLDELKAFKKACDLADRESREFWKE